MIVSQQIATELSVQEHQVRAAIQLLNDAPTVPFIARYRKEVTGGLDDDQSAFPGGAPALPAELGGTPSGHPEQYPRTGQDDP